LLPSGKLLVTGGQGITPVQSGTPPSDPGLATAELYDPGAGTWTFAGSMSQPRQLHSATLMPGGKVLVAGGLNFFGSVFPTGAELYDPATGKWSPTLPLTSGRTDHIAALLPDGKVLVAGGFNSSDTGPSTELFDPSALVPEPILLNPPVKLQDGTFQLTFRNTPGLNFLVWASGDIMTPTSNWTPAGAALEVTPGHYRFTDAPVDIPQRFYRVGMP
jgi:hypothetical protein